MDLTSKRVIKNLLKKCKVFPSKRLGQIFLTDKVILRKFIKIANVQPKDTILEIGPGIGNLTKKLAIEANKVIAIEKDRKMIEILKETLKNFKNIGLIAGDILKVDLKIYNLKPKTYKVVANLPYYIVAPTIRKFLESQNPPKEMVLIVQKEVAQKICAKVPKMNLLAVSVQFYANPEINSFIPKKSFWPQPKVDGAILKISNIKNQKLKINKDLFFKIVRAGFSHPRKQLVNNLSKELKVEKEKIKDWLLKNKIQPTQRAETLSIQDWKNLAKSFSFINS